MKRIHISELSEHIGQTVVLEGWAQTIRDQGNIVFIILRDVTGTVQTVTWKDAPEALALAKTVSLESVLHLEGLVKEEKQAPGGIELSVQKLTVLSMADPQLPIPVIEKDENETEQATRIDWRWIDLRKPKNLLIQQVWSTLEGGFRRYWTEHGYINIHSPKIMSTPSESGAELFEVQYFDRKAYLAQSPQFYKQMAMAGGLERVFEVGPVFRAEPSFTPRHATEYFSYDAEISFIESHQDVIDELENVIINALTHVKEKYGDKIKELFDRDLVIPAKPFPQLTMKEAKELLKAAGVPDERDGDLSPEEERRLSEIVKEKFGHEFVFVTEYPAAVRAFYHMRKEDDPTLTKSFDLLWNGIEIVTGAQREHNYEKLKQQAQEKGLSLEGLEHYLNFFKYGCPPHGGFGLGPERLVMKICNIDNIRDISFVYRGVKRLTP